MYFSMRIIEVLGVILAPSFSIGKIEIALIVKNNPASIVSASVPGRYGDYQILKL